MSRPFKVHELLSSSELEELEGFAREPGRTIDECHAWLGQRGHELARSSVGTWKRALDQRVMAERMSGAGRMAAAFMDAASADGGLKITDAAVMTIAQMIFERGAALQAEEQIDPHDLSTLALAMQRLMLAKSRLEETRSEFQERERKAVEEASKAAQGGASGGDVVATIKRALGIELSHGDTEARRRDPSEPPCLSASVVKPA
jgi:hypothetical protein